MHSHSPSTPRGTAKTNSIAQEGLTGGDPMRLERERSASCAELARMRWFSLHDVYEFRGRSRAILVTKEPISEL